jgi:acetylornithine deacetylase/succinyl-diaminopimelate desuccinylase-like protein
MDWRGLAWSAAAGALIFGPMALAAPLSTVPPPVDQAIARDILEELIAIDTVEPRGSRAAAEALAKRFRDAGLADVQILAPDEAPNKADAVVRLKGSGKARPVLWICHLDVVEAKPEDWTVPPFQVTVKDGFLYGRGTADVKGECAAIAESLIRLKREGYVPDRDIIAAFTSDEESGATNGVEWLLKAHRPLIGAEFVLNPDGGGGSMRAGKPLFFAVQTSEKIYLTFQLETTNKGGHSSLPVKENAIVRLTEGVARLAKHEFPVHLTDTTRDYFREMAAFETGQKKADMLAVAGPGPDPAAVERLSADALGHAQLRTTCVFTQIEGGHAENALPQRARASYQCRVMPGETQEQIQAQVLKALDDPQIAVTVISPMKPTPESPPRPALMAKVAQAVHSIHPGIPVIPWMDLGASDGVYTRSVGLPTYAMGSIFGDMDDVRIHGRDERIGVQQFSEGVELTYRFMKATSAAR